MGFNSFLIKKRKKDKKSVDRRKDVWYYIRALNEAQETKNISVFEN